VHNYSGGCRGLFSRGELPEGGSNPAAWEGGGVTAVLGAFLPLTYFLISTPHNSLYNIRIML
jgi:hypothetical protein